MVSGEKRNCEDENGLERITTILLDIEGTTTSISFVKDTLFPYIRENLETYVNDHWNDDEFKADLKALKSQAEKDAEEKVENFCSIEEGDKEKETLIKNVLWQMDLDRKTTALKQLQGHIWREGYESGKLKGHIYGEVAQVLKKWGEDGRKLYIYSSGSVEAQKLLFKNSESGDLSEYLSGYFDTEVGPKTEASSYTNIAKAVGCDPGQILFLTDVVKEAVAADKAGLHAMIVVREGNAPLVDDEKKAFVTLSSLKDLVFESSTKKKKICEDDGQGKKASEKAENEKETEESKEMKNGDAEKMETEITEIAESQQKTEEERDAETKAEEDGRSQADADAGVDANAATQITESEAIEVDVESSVAAEGERESAEKTESEGEKIEQKTSSEENASEAEAAESSEEKKAVTESGEDGEKEKKENEDKKKEEKEEKEEKSVNGHENGENGENEEKEAEPAVPAAAEEAKNGDANGKTEEEAMETMETMETMEAVAVKKVAASDEAADSTVEVTA